MNIKSRFVSNILDEILNGLKFIKLGLKFIVALKLPFLGRARLNEIVKFWTKKHSKLLFSNTIYNRAPEEVQ